MPAHRHVHSASISLLKQQLQTVRHNIATLEQQLVTGCDADSGDIKEQTSKLLRAAEQAPLSKLQRFIAKQKHTRLLKKIKKEGHKQPTKQQKSTATPNITADDESPATTSCNQTQQPDHQQLRNCYNAQQLLRRFELLEMLHLARSGDADTTQHFAAQFSHLRAIWNSVLAENLPQRTKERKTEEQWNEVFFGPSERLYYGSERKIGDFVRIRRTWDTYLTRNRKRGSCIPTGWILPNADATPAWQQYRATSTK